MDDATSDIYSAFFRKRAPCRASRGCPRRRAKGLFCSLYADRASHYSPEAGGKVDKDTPTQVGRALAQLGIELIPAYSPEARGRSERMFGTLQKRLPQELRLDHRHGRGADRPRPDRRLTAQTSCDPRKLSRRAMTPRRPPPPPVGGLE